MMTGISMVHVPYRGTGPALSDLLGGQVQVMFATMPAALEYIKTGKLARLGRNHRDALGRPSGEGGREIEYVAERAQLLERPAAAACSIPRSPSGIQKSPTSRQRPQLRPLRMTAALSS